MHKIEEVIGLTSFPQGLSKYEYYLPATLKQYQGRLIKTLGDFITKERIEKFNKVGSLRSRRVLTLFENTHHAHNISAVLRSIESQGFMEGIFLYSNPEMKFRAAESVDRGASQWLILKKSSHFQQCIRFLKTSGYKIAVVSLPEFSKSAQHFESNIPSFFNDELGTERFQRLVEESPVAVIFGTELYGVSKEWFTYADFYLSVRMFGFTESLNVSVCAGIVLQSLRRALVESHPGKYYLSDFEKELTIEHWIAKTCPKAGEIVRERYGNLQEWYEFIKKPDFFIPFESIHS
ncbi:MAG: hypothetical protein K2X39_05280 [Silvanigrellaceae bacterium]|nr:hypothetical protein [Silvanigrellaceae bacterium]